MKMKKKKKQSPSPPLSLVVETINEASLGLDPLPVSMSLTPPTASVPLDSAVAMDADTVFAAIDAALHAPLTYTTVAAWQLPPLPSSQPPSVPMFAPDLCFLPALSPS
jgi:hypothetical protein